MTVTQTQNEQTETWKAGRFADTLFVEARGVRLASPRPRVAALQLAACGWAVFPCVPGGKRPLGRLAPHGFLDATMDAMQIRAWWSPAPALDANMANIAIRTGAASNLVVLDLDGEAGLTALGELEARFGLLPPAPTVSTPRGGRHIYFAHPGRIVPCSVGRLAPAVDVRGDGGYVVAPPSATRTGRWTWLPGRSLHDLDPPPLPAAWRQALTGPGGDGASRARPADLRPDPGPPCKQSRREYRAQPGRQSLVVDILLGAEITLSTRVEIER